jgi:hypothetical protein
MDEAIVTGHGGFQTRAELMTEAVENLLNELEYPEAPDEPMRPPTDRGSADRASADSPGRGPLDELLAAIPSSEREQLTLGDLAGTALRAPEKPSLVSDELASVPSEPLLGLHNRDYVSIWALHRLARYTAEGAVPFEDYVKRATRAAWYFGDQLDALERGGHGRKLTVLFPTNFTKRPSAERGFQSFAIGTVPRRTDVAPLHVAGPLFAWRAIQLRGDGELLVGITEEGWRLIRDLDGLSLDLPHRREHALRFLGHLGQHAPEDRWGFDQLLRAAADGPDRDALLASFAATHPEWTDATASSIAQGYVARSREWGLVEPKMVEGRYWLTDTGRELLKELA